MKNYNYIKKSLCILCATFFIVLSGCGDSKPKESEKVSLSKAESITVYITKTGECYHNDFCSCLSKSKIKKDLKAKDEKTYQGEINHHSGLLFSH